MTTISDEDVFLEATKGFMMEHAFIIPAKIAGAEGAGLYDLKMENAALIRKAAREDGRWEMGVGRWEMGDGRWELKVI